MTIPMSALVAGKALRHLDPRARRTLLRVLNRWLEELDAASATKRVAPQRKAAIKVHNALRTVTGARGR